MAALDHHVKQEELDTNRKVAYGKSTELPLLPNQQRAGHPPLFPLALLLPGVAGAAVTDAQKCESSVEKASGKYASCLLAAESKFTKTGDATKLADAEAKCAATFEKVFTKATDKYGVDCPMVDPAQAFMDYLGTCSEGVVAGADGGSVPSGGSAGALKTTGQTTSYGAGSDGALQAGLSKSYTDNGDGTITDNVTGLMWEKKSDDGSIHDKDNTCSDGGPPQCFLPAMATTARWTLAGSMPPPADGQQSG